MKKIIAPLAVLVAAILLITSFVGFASKEQAERVYEESAIEELYAKGIVEGYDDGKLHPEDKLTRAQFAKILNNAFKDGAAHEILYNFNDLDKSHWAYDDIQKAINRGWLEGFGDNTFKPDANITYEQALTVICRVIGVVPYGAQYPTDYVSAAIQYSIADKVDAVIGDEINREQASRLIVNAINYDEFQFEETRYSSASAVYPPGVAGGGSSGGAPQQSSAESSAVYDESAEGALSVNEAPLGVYMPPYANSEEYTTENENVFKDALTSPLSTFSIDTDTASYSNLRRFILNGQTIPNGAVRSEELINYFDYTNAETEEGKPFGVSCVVSDCPWNPEHDLAMVTVSGEELKEAKPSNLVFLIDTSGSMYSYNKLPLVKQALSMLLDKLGENDTVSIVTYASGTGVALEPTPATEKEKILEVIDSLSAGGATAGASGINLAYSQAEKSKIDGNNRIILCTDGDFNVGISSSGDLEALITGKRKSGIYLSVLGFGMGNYKDSKMELLADKGNGNYAYIDNLREAKKVLVDEMSKTIYTIAKDVKIQAEFNPEKVSQYRLIGYENRMLNNEDFDNDAKDAGELGAGAAVTVLYEIIPAKGDEKSDLKYQTTETTGSSELMTVKIRYKEPDGAESILSEYPVLSEKTEPTADFNFAAAVAELGMILNDSEFKGSSTYDSVIELAKSGIGEDTFGLRCEFVQLVDLLRYKER